MGGWTTGIMVGIIEPAGLNLEGHNGTGGGLLDDWRHACRKEIKALEHSGSLARYEYATDRIVPATECCANVPLCGFWVAAGGSGKPGCLDLPAAIDMLAIESIEPYASGIKVARERWKRFADFATKRGVKLPEAKLMLADTEVA